MASRYDRITKLYQYAQEQVASPEGWRDFLRTACRNYRLTFPDQLLVYIQRPDATAVLEIEKWNNGFGRWVNRGAKGIAVFNEQYDGKQRLKYYFDISDTHEGRNARAVPVWEMKAWLDKRSTNNWARGKVTELVASYNEDYEMEFDVFSYNELNK